tara:strand:- start:1079 stop:1258 length:180 start_codon:yes stop_codon:yes gene_type:complete
MSEMSRIPESSHEVGFEDGDAEGVVGERDPLRSIDDVRISKLKIVVNGETIYDYGSEEE